jgi:hypothetical protein
MACMVPCPYTSSTLGGGLHLSQLELHDEHSVLVRPQDHPADMLVAISRVELGTVCGAYLVGAMRVR